MTRFSSAATSAIATGLVDLVLPSSRIPAELLRFRAPPSVREREGKAGSDIEAEMPANARFDFGTSFAGQLGAGVEWFPSERIGVRLDARNLLWRLQVPDAFFLTENGRALPASEWEQNYLVSAGISVHF